MANDTRLTVRKAIVSKVRAVADVSQILGARFYGQKVPAKPAWPFGRYGTPTIIPDRATGTDGIRVIVSLHFFSKDAKGEDEASNLAAAAGKALDGYDVTREGHDISVTWTGGQTLPDGDEADAWHATCDLEVLVTSDP